MPVYEYVCGDSGQRISEFFWKISNSQGSPYRCSSKNLKQLFFRIFMVQSEKKQMASMSDPSKWATLTRITFNLGPYDEKAEKKYS